LPRALGTPPLQRLAEHHRSADLREKALKALVERALPDEAAPLLEHAAVHDPSGDVQEEAVEALSELPSAIAVPIAQKLVSSHPNPEVRTKALKIILDLASPADAIAELEKATRQDSSSDVREEAVDALAKLPSEAGVP